MFQTTDGSGPLRAGHVGGLGEFMQRVQTDPNVVRVANLDPRITPAQYALMYADPNNIADAYGQRAPQATVRTDTVPAQVTSRFGQTDARSKDLVRAIRATPLRAGFRLLAAERWA